MARKPAYITLITLKDNKENFNINPKCPLINSAKSEHGKVAKYIVENINKTVRQKLHCNQWRNTSNVIDWIQNITDKGNCIFIQFDIEEFYPSITKHLLLKATNMQSFTSVSLNKSLTSSYTSKNPYCFPKINLGRKELLNHYLT